MQLDWHGCRKLIRTLVKRIEIDQQRINVVFRLGDSTFPGGNPFLPHCRERDATSFPHGLDAPVMLGAIALGLLQLIALKFSSTLWQQHVGFLRTRSRTLPSERTVKQVVAPLIVRDFLNPAASRIMREIRTHFSTPPAAPQDPQNSPEAQSLAA